MTTPVEIPCIGCVVMLLDHREDQSADFGVFCSAEAGKVGCLRHFSTMSLTTDFIGDLVRDANRIDRLDACQKRRMLERAVATIKDLREAVGIPKGPGRDIVLDIHTTALSVERGWRDDIQVRETFLLAAGMIRDLHIVLDSGTTVSLV